MTICNGCGMGTDASICCPICLKYNKSIFYCSQQCYELNYNDHKKIHYFIKRAISNDIHKKINEANEVVLAREELPVVVLNSERETTEKAYNQTTRSAEHLHSYKNFEYEKTGGIGNVHNKGIGSGIGVGINQNVPENGRVSMQMNHEEYMHAKNTLYENKQRKKSHNNYKVLNNENFLFYKENGSGKEEQETEKEEQEKERKSEGNRRKERIKTRERTGKRKRKPNTGNSFPLLNWLHFLFPKKYNFVLPYYEDIEMENKNRTGFKEVKMTNKQYLELKKLFKKRRIVQLCIILAILATVVIISTIFFTRILENFHNKNINVLKTKMGISNENTTAETRGYDFQDMKAYMYAIEDLKKEINEMKEILYVHNVYMQKNFNLSNSFDMFNNFNKKKEKVYGKKKNEDSLNNFTTYNFAKESSSRNNQSKDTVEGGNEEEFNFKQSHYDVSAIKELNQTEGSRKSVEVNAEKTEETKEQEDLNKEEKLIMGKQKDTVITGNDVDEIHKMKNKMGEFEAAHIDNSFIHEKTEEHSNNMKKVQEMVDVEKEIYDKKGIDKKELDEIQKQENSSLNKNSINQHETRNKNSDNTLGKYEMDSARVSDIKQIKELYELNERKPLLSKLSKTKQQTI